jgi:hypothetical protein
VPRLRTSLCAALVCGLAACGGEPARAPDVATFALERVGDGPLIHPPTPGLPGRDGENLNGPSVIRVPDWLPQPRGRYYMYFAHHNGAYIRFAHAPAPEGPWTVVPGGVLHLRDTAASDHVASPDVHVDAEAREIRMYFHGCLGECAPAQQTFVATSPDGVSFRARPEPLGPSYFRVFRRDGFYYALAKKKEGGGVLLRSRDGLSRFEPGPELLPRMRHAALHADGGRLVVFYSRIGDAPESILRSVVPLTGDWLGWQASEPELVLAPERDFEGASLPLEPSRAGRARKPRRQLRDPGLLVDGAAWLYYSVAGEQGIAVARFVPPAGGEGR